MKGRSQILKLFTAWAIVQRLVNVCVALKAVQLPTLGTGQHHAGCSLCVLSSCEGLHAAMAQQILVQLCTSLHT